MIIVDLVRRAQQRRIARAIGRDAALGLPVDLTDASAERPGARCPQCGRLAHVDVLDIPAARSHLRCTDCGNHWDLDHAVPTRRGRIRPDA